MMGFDMLLDNFIELFQKTYSNFFSPRYRYFTCCDDLISLSLSFSTLLQEECALFLGKLYLIEH